MGSRFQQRCVNSAFGYLAPNAYGAISTPQRDDATELLDGSERQFVVNAALCATCYRRFWFTLVDSRRHSSGVMGHEALYCAEVGRNFEHVRPKPRLRLGRSGRPRGGYREAIIRERNSGGKVGINFEPAGFASATACRPVRAPHRRHARSASSRDM